jgi:hypothetical protein
MAYRDESNTAFGGTAHEPSPLAGLLSKLAGPGCVKSSADKLVDFVIWLKSERPELMEPGKALRLLRQAAEEYEQHERAKTSARAAH